MRGRTARKGTGRPTMRDVSMLAGVSVMTVSRALVTPERVSPGKLALVRNAIAKTGYVPDRNAGALSSSKSGIVGLLLPTLANANFADCAEGLTEVLLPQGLQPLIGYAGHSLEKEEELVRIMLARRPDAFVLIGTEHTRETVRMLNAGHIPVVETWEHTPSPIDSCISFSNARAGELAAEHLIALGHRRLAALGGSLSGSLRDARGDQRLVGFERAVRARGLPEPQIIRTATVPIRHGAGADGMAELLRSDARPDAVFAISDTLAFGAMMECVRRDLDVPGDLSVIGFGDFDMAAQTVPGITTITVRPRDLGRRIGWHLLERIDKGMVAMPGINDLIEPTIVERGSTRSAHGS